MTGVDLADHLVVIRGGGDLGTGVAFRLHRSGLPIVVTELPEPLTIRRTVALSSAIRDGEITVEGMVGRRAASMAEALEVSRSGIVPVVVHPVLEDFRRSVVVDARLAKTNLDTRLTDAPLVVGLGPGFTAGRDCHAVVETARGHHLGRVFWSGSAAPNTGRPGEVGGRSAERVVRAPVGGGLEWFVEIGDRVPAGAILGRVGGVDVIAACAGVVRGLISSSVHVHVGLKVADIDPRTDTSTSEISDKALAIGGGVLEGVMTWISATR